MNREFNEFDEVFIISELRDYIRYYGSSCLPKPQTVINTDRSDTDNLVRKHEVSRIVRRLVQEEKKKFMEEMEGRVANVLRQTIFEDKPVRWYGESTEEGKKEYDIAWM